MITVGSEFISLSWIGLVFGFRGKPDSADQTEHRSGRHISALHNSCPWPGLSDFEALVGGVGPPERDRRMINAAYTLL